MSTHINSAIASDFLQNLKTQTADSHQKLEDLSVSKSIMSPNMELEDYIHYLSLMHDVHNDTETIIFPFFSNLIEDLEQRRKKHLIEYDLLFLNSKKTDSATVFHKDEMSVPFALGVLYVVEGSTLGGRFILKNVSKRPELSGEKGVSYFSGYGERTGSFWKAFLNFLSEYEQKHECGEEIIEGAVFAFDSIYKHFEGR
ncbi:biliverdin-producing heme oxygenase [Flavobacterium quisquiliarum]|uniref:Biliverdin-producing heme oxygenase n=1 Tax=Flavobacterium quisquiliarum TaxID=1834436 RepID=A0ABV8W3F8_9FLAO|nr:biliverdin-producing heme oxygenase [Flavobacterium quisquiliarum]MBW1653854.1 heme oxygenase [Flavobacterium quisquiliarum]NWL01557.1 heme oxygenase [Flavobacterium collinsii]